MTNFDDVMLFDLKMLRMVAEAKVITLEKQDDGDNLDRAQVVAKILEDDDCFLRMTLNEILEVLISLGFKPEFARTQAENLYCQYHSDTKKLSHIKK